MDQRETQLSNGKLSFASSLHEGPPPKGVPWWLCPSDACGHLAPWSARHKGIFVLARGASNNHHPEQCDPNVADMTRQYKHVSSVY